MIELLHDPVFLVFGFLTVTAVVGILTGAWQRHKQQELEAALKQEMLQRGLSAEEIRVVIEATSQGKRKPRIVGMAVGLGCCGEKPGEGKR
jgi:hypothetical protein